MKWFKYSFLLFSILGLSLSFVSCGGDENPRAIVKVVKMDSNGVEWPQNNAEVRFDLPEGTSLPQLISFAQKPKLTDMNGEVEYEVDYDGVINIIATFGDAAESCGQGVIIFTTNEVYQEKVRLSACYE
ncbi:MAG: hypothetical protein K9I34_03875 [Bacteroidales bacterium]|nr:hypothetical protein [Bacteroidales bacterium]